MTFSLRCPESFLAERTYTFDVLLRRFLGVDFTVATHSKPTVEISRGGVTLVVHDCFLGGDASAWRHTASLPKFPLRTFPGRRLSAHPGVPDRVPILYGDESLTLDTDRIEWGLDAFAGAFFMLSQYEQEVVGTRDEHERFPAAASIAARAGFLSCPIINVYVELLWSCLIHLWPDLERPKRSPRMLLSCDVDWPFKTDLRSAIKVSRQIGWYLVKEGSPSRALRHIQDCIAVARNGLSADPYCSFPFYLNQAERAGLPVAFYFIAAHTAGNIDGTYSLSDSVIRDLLTQIHRGGHEIGLHPSYNTFRSTTAIRRELEVLQTTCRRLGIEQNTWGARQHFLRWEPATFRRYSDAGLSYDSTLAFASQAGFRAGVCYEYPAYDLDERRPLPLIVRPLIAMDGTFLETRYMGLSPAEACNMLDKLMSTCHDFGGDFTLLWHNSMLSTPDERGLFCTALESMGRLHARK